MNPIPGAPFFVCALDHEAIDDQVVALDDRDERVFVAYAKPCAPPAEDEILVEVGIKALGRPLTFQVFGDRFVVWQTYAKGGTTRTYYAQRWEDVERTLPPP